MAYIAVSVLNHSIELSLWMSLAALLKATRASEYWLFYVKYRSSALYAILIVLSIPNPVTV